MSQTVYVRYTVQKGDTLLTLWHASGMTRDEWMAVNQGRNPDGLLKAGEQIVLKDPDASCRQEDVLDNMGCPFSGESCYQRCDNHPLFKPLKKYTRLLETPKSVPSNRTYVFEKERGLEGLI